MNTQAEIPQLVTVTRGQYLLKNERRIRDMALPARNSDPDVAKHLAGVLMAEDFIDRHEVAAEANRKVNREHLARDHDRFVEMAKQFKLFHLDILATLLI